MSQNDTLLLVCLRATYAAIVGSNMARLRFPGRPGNRIGRLRIPYSSDGPDIESDPTFRYISHVKNGLQNFREAFGESDEVSSARKSPPLVHFPLHQRFKVSSFVTFVFHANIYHCQLIIR